MTRKSEDAGRSTIRDVAACAGVSASTVSRVLGGVYPVSAATRGSVMRAVRELSVASQSAGAAESPYG
ncbi:LacI family DNA-binding transcriptional regulator [Streptomyces luteogriseus]|uniref:DNA-binding LacI/PurR family transcriptional regulator n=1 Tax=Streptomyces luteogriseus TaxID=68233 RepID=A0A7W7DLT5_9ACTN|nr:DNA-binding LacI/PurR family transcriptional regulator [Streptomyces luteogriseus]